MEQSTYKKIRQRNQLKENIYRDTDDYFFELEKPDLRDRELYSWEEDFVVGGYPKITKEFLRCRGSELNPYIKVINEDGEQTKYYDCGGIAEHGLPLIEDREFVYPALLDLLNYIQYKTGKQVIVTSGHRCPKHNTYADPSKYNNMSKHMIAAEVDFYVKGMEGRAEDIVQMIFDYYPNDEFKRYEKNDTNVSTPPWYNKEVFVKLYREGEGRDCDNEHPYPYIGIMVRYDKAKKERVIYSWKQAYKGYLRF
jgi:hypothetical protein